MCLGLPGQVVELLGEASMLAVVETEGVRRTISLEVIGPEADVQVGDWVLAHLGFAMSKLEEHEAQETLALMAMFEDPEPAPEVAPQAVPEGEGRAGGQGR